MNDLQYFRTLEITVDEQNRINGGLAPLAIGGIITGYAALCAVAERAGYAAHAIYDQLKD